MNTNSLLAILGAAAVGIGLLSGPANASPKAEACTSMSSADGTQPKALSHDEIRAKLAAEGYAEIRSLRAEHGCVEAKGTDRSGRRFEVYVNPASGQIVTRK